MPLRLYRYLLLEVIKAAWESCGQTTGVVDVILDVKERGERQTTRTNIRASRRLGFFLFFFFCGALGRIKDWDLD